MSDLIFKLDGADRAAPQVEHRVEQLVIAGWTGRDEAAVEHHIQELAALGVKRPGKVPTFYRVSASLLTTAETIQVPGDNSSGEVECVLLSTRQGLLLGVGSDHTDRQVESFDVTVSKQMCPKPVGADLWRFDDVADHWDDLLMRCWRERGGERELYQEGPVTALRDPRDLVSRYASGSGLPVGTAMFCGTQPVIGVLGAGTAFELELFDPRSKRSLRHRYAVQALPVEA
jgi:hypothetical protein